MTLQELCGLKTYVVGSKTAKKAVIYVYDAFGMTAQAFQGELHTDLDI